jgi:hypothetical protein
MARLHGCSINVEIRRFGHVTTVSVTPNFLMKGDVQTEVTIDEQPTEVIGIDPARQQQQDESGENA